MKHAVILGIIVALCAVPALAGAEPGPELCFADALELMYENNAALQIAQLNLEIAQIDYDKAMVGPDERLAAELCRPNTVWSGRRTPTVPRGRTAIWRLSEPILMSWQGSAQLRYGSSS